MTTEYGHDEAISFGPFQLFRTRRQLLEGDRDVCLGSRAMDILIALLEQPGKLLSKPELMTIVWPDTVVVEANLTVHVAALRRALRDGQAGNRYIVNIPGRGYRFVGAVEHSGQLSPPVPSAAAVGGPHNLPARLTRLIGREDFVGNLVQQIPAQRLMTIVGPPGIGKTATALDVARRMTRAYKDGVWLLDSGQISDPRLLPAALSLVLKPEGRSDNNRLPELIADARDKQMLLILDNCEHVIEAAAALADGLLRGSRGFQILATSREPLRVEGERVHRLTPLESPPASVQLSAAEALAYPAVELLVHCVVANVDDFTLADADASSAGDICRKLDGLPLAIQLAAARVPTFGVHGLAARLDDRLRLLTTGRRTALPRHRTITAAFDWSHELLSPEEQAVLRRLAIFAGGFTLEAASAVVAGSDLSLTDVADTITNLMMKSLVVADAGERTANFRLLEITRAFARTKLANSDEFDAVSQRHALYHQDMPEMVHERSYDDKSRITFEFDIENMRAALDRTLTREATSDHDDIGAHGPNVDRSGDVESPTGKVERFEAATSRKHKKMLEISHA